MTSIAGRVRRAEVLVVLGPAAEPFVGRQLEEREVAPAGVRLHDLDLVIFIGVPLGATVTASRRSSAARPSEAHEIVRRGTRNPVRRDASRAAGAVRRDQQVRRAPQWIVRRQGLRIGDIEPRAGNLAGGQRRFQRDLIDDAAARDVSR